MCIYGLNKMGRWTRRNVYTILVRQREEQTSHSMYNDSFLNTRNTKRPYLCIHTQLLMRTNLALSLYNERVLSFRSLQQVLNKCFLISGYFTNVIKFMLFENDSYNLNLFMYSAKYNLKQTFPNSKISINVLKIQHNNPPKLKCLLICNRDWQIFSVKARQ